MTPLRPLIAYKKKRPIERELPDQPLNKKVLQEAIPKITPSADRYIPLRRKGIGADFFNHKPSVVDSSDQTATAYRKLMASTLSAQPDRKGSESPHNERVLLFSEGQQEPRYPYKPFQGFNLKNSTPETCVKILDAPEILDNFYHQALCHSSKTNAMAIILGSQVYIMKDGIKPLKDTDFPFEQSPISIAFTSSGERLIVGTEDGMLKCYKVSDIVV